MAKQVWIENGIIVFYGNRAGYVREGYAVADPVFHTSELEGFLKKQGQIRDIVWEERTFELLESRKDIKEAPGGVKRVRVWQLDPGVDIEMKFISYAETKRLFGMRKGENEYTYPQYERVQAEELLECLRKIAPCIIIDCSSYIANDILSAVSLMEADSVLRLTGCDLKSVSYFSSQLPLLKESKWDADKQYKAASNVRPNEASAHMEQVLGNTVFQIPYSREVEEQVLQGNLFKELGLKESRGFRRAIEAVTGEVFGC